MNKHTPTPLQQHLIKLPLFVSQDDGGDDENGGLEELARWLNINDYQEQEELAEQIDIKISLAVNSHEELLESLKEVLAQSELPAGIIRNKAVKAIAKAEGK